MTQETAMSSVAIVTGAGSGVGRATAVMLSGLGWSVVLAGRREDALVETGGELGGEWLAVPTDIGNPADIGPLVARTLERFGRIDAVINNAGTAGLDPIGTVSPERIEALYRVNAIGPTMLIREAWGALTESEGRVVSVSSKASRDPFPGLGIYGGAKSALNVITKGISNEGKRAGIRAFCVAPGAIETGMLRGMFSESQLPASGCLAPEDVARRIVDCAAGARDEDAGRTIFLIPGEEEAVD